MLLIFLSGTCLGNDTVKVKIPLIRQHFHDRIDEEQRLMDRADGKQDSSFHAGSQELLTEKSTDALFGRVNKLQDWVETNSRLASNNDKVRFLKYIENLLNRFRTSYKKYEIGGQLFLQLFDGFEKMLFALDRHEPILSFVESSSYEIARIYSEVFMDNRDYPAMRSSVYLKFAVLNADKILQTIGPYVNEPYADSLVILSCHLNPVQFYSYAQSPGSPQGRLIHRSTDPMVRAVAEISRTPRALFYFPFLDDILAGRKSIDSLRQLIGTGESSYDSVGYFRLLVNTNIEYCRRLSPPLRDTPIAMFGPNGLREMLRLKSIQHFISPINELHNQPNLNIRMAAIEPLSAEEIYFMLVMGENEIYTSSYKHSFNKLLQRMGDPPRGDSLLQRVYFDQFRKFIKMAASYNKLDTFLRTMPATRSEILMKAFVTNLDKSGSLEDAVDVADAYSSITDKKLLLSIRSYVSDNEQQALADSNQRGAVIYGLLHKIFIAADSSSEGRSPDALGIQSLYSITPAELQDDSGRIVQQVFFYGDEDGKNIFPAYLNSFSLKEWKIIAKDEWVEVRSLNGKVWIYANKPLDYDLNLDDTAQAHLAEYLESLNIRPSLVVHRGHSYWLPGTIARMPADAKIIVIGSCGGYKNLNEIIASSPHAHIISTKEIGTGEINRPILNYLNQSFINGRTVIWKNMWSSLSSVFARDPAKELYESWQNYIPPYRNLGAIFISAYNNAMIGTE